MASVTKLFNTPAVYELPLTKGQDLECTFIYKPLVVDIDGEPVLTVDGQRQYAGAPYPAGATVALTIDTTPPLVVEATISGAEALVTEDFLIVDTVEAKKLWRVVITYLNGRNKVMANGLTSRADGK